MISTSYNIAFIYHLDDCRIHSLINHFVELYPSITFHFPTNFYVFDIRGFTPTEKNILAMLENKAAIYWYLQIWDLAIFVVRKHFSFRARTSTPNKNGSLIWNSWFCLSMVVLCTLCNFIYTVVRRNLPIFSKYNR